MLRPPLRCLTRSRPRRPEGARRAGLSPASGRSIMRAPGRPLRVHGRGSEGCGEVAERSKALDWNSSNIFTGVRGFESHPLRQIWRHTKYVRAHPRFFPTNSLRYRLMSSAQVIPRAAEEGTPANVRGARHIIAIRTGLILHRGSQFSTRKSGTRENSRTLSVTTVRSSARACAAMRRSFGPIGLPCRARCWRISP